MLSGHGGIGRRVRLRGVWLHRPSSSLGDRTTKKISTDCSVLIFFCVQGNETFVTTSKERRKRVAFAEIVRSGHSKQI